MLLLNYSHPLNATQLAQIATLLRAEPQVRTIPVQIDQEQPLQPQIVALVDGAGLSAEEWQTTPLVVNPPGLAPAAVALMAEIHGRTGHFPALLRLRPLAGSTPTQFEVAEILNLQAIRDVARLRR